MPAEKSVYICIKLLIDVPETYVNIIVKLPKAVIQKSWKLGFQKKMVIIS